MTELRMPEETSKCGEKKGRKDMRFQFDHAAEMQKRVHLAYIYEHG